jgi:predicted DNA-binding transcriptional regulator YafY
MAKASTAHRARLLIALLGRMKNGSVISLSEMAAEVGSSPAELASDLTTLSMCGIAPYSPWELVPLSIEGDRVEVFGSVPAMRGPVRLSLAEAEALSAALSAAGFSADDPLNVKLAAATSASLDADELSRTLHTETSKHDVGIFEALAAAIRDRLAVKLAYQRDGADTPGDRTVEPLQLLAERGAWYLSAWCREADDFRTFRVDRIRGLEATGERFEPAAHGTSGLSASAFTADGLPVARLRFTRPATYVERDWPGSRLVERPENGDEVAEVPFAGTDWIARRVVARLGSVEVLEPEAVRAAVVTLAREESARSSHLVP